MRDGSGPHPKAPLFSTVEELPIGGTMALPTQFDIMRGVLVGGHLNIRSARATRFNIYITDRTMNNARPVRSELSKKIAHTLQLVVPGFSRRI